MFYRCPACAELFAADTVPLARCADCGMLLRVSPPEAAPEALARTTHLGICAHQDDLEILAMHGILECFHKPGKGFCGVVVTDGAGSARDFEYADYTDEQMKDVRRVEQKKAAFIGEFSAMVLLNHPSKTVKSASEKIVVEDLVRVLEATRPEAVYTHNLADNSDACRK